jgi:hypothetical protein
MPSPDSSENHYEAGFAAKIIHLAFIYSRVP